VKKREIGPGTYLYPLPTLLVGAQVEGRPNYITIVYSGIIQHAPPMISVTMGKSHYTGVGIRASGSFSVNIPSEKMVEVTDCIGTYSSSQIDKCGLFKAFYGKLENAPMIEECPLNLECRLADTLDYGGQSITFVGEIVAVYAKKEALTKGFPDIEKIRPIIFSIHDNNYYSLGTLIGRAWQAGKGYTQR